MLRPNHDFDARGFFRANYGNPLLTYQTLVAQGYCERSAGGNYVSMSGDLLTGHESNRVPEIPRYYFDQVLNMGMRDGVTDLWSYQIAHMDAPWLGVSDPQILSAFNEVAGDAKSLYQLASNSQVYLQYPGRVYFAAGIPQLTFQSLYDQGKSAANYVAPAPMTATQIYEQRLATIPPDSEDYWQVQNAYAVMVQEQQAAINTPDNVAPNMTFTIQGQTVGSNHPLDGRYWLLTNGGWIPANSYVPGAPLSDALQQAGYTTVYYYSEPNKAALIQVSQYVPTSAPTYAPAPSSPGVYTMNDPSNSPVTDIPPAPAPTVITDQQVLDYVRPIIDAVQAGHTDAADAARTISAAMGTNGVTLTQVQRAMANDGYSAAQVVAFLALANQSAIPPAPSPAPSPSPVGSPPAGAPAAGLDAVKIMGVLASLYALFGN